MKAQHVIEAQLYSLEGILPGGDAFNMQYANYRSGPTTRYVFQDTGVFLQALALLRKYHLDSQQYYQFELEPHEIAVYPAIYFATTVVDNALVSGILQANTTGDAELLMDYGTEKIICSVRARNVIESVTTRLRWVDVDASDGTEWSILAEAADLPDPIIIPAPVEVNRNEHPPNTYSVRSDGRDVVTPGNVTRLAHVGLAASRHAMIGSERKPWKPRYIASGRVIDALQAASIHGLLEALTPLLAQSHPLAKTR